MNEILKKGSRGAGVVRLQERLNLYPDGIFGPLTEEAVKQFQRGQGLAADGIVGAKTWTALEKAGTQPAQSFLAEGPGGLRLKKSKRNINEIIVHCSGTESGKPVTVDAIRRAHMAPQPKGRRWSDIGYHYVVYIDGSVHEGRDVHISGAHASGHNSRSVGVCYVGGLNKGKEVDTRTPAQKQALVALLKALKKLYPQAKILGHRDTSPDKNGNGVIDPFERIKACPCFDAIPEYKGI